MRKTSIKPFVKKINEKNRHLRDILDGCDDLKEEFLQETEVSKLDKGDLKAMEHLIDDADKYDFGHLVEKMDENSKVFRKPISEIIENLGIQDHAEGKEFMLGLLRLILLQTTFSKEFK